MESVWELHLLGDGHQKRVGTGASNVCADYSKD